MGKRGWVKGRPRGPGSGRQKGVLNYRSFEVIKTLRVRGFDPLIHILDKLPEMDLKDQVYVSLQLMPYVYPRRGILEIKTEEQSQSKEVLDLQKLVAEERIPSIKFLEARLGITKGDTNGTDSGIIDDQVIEDKK